MSAVYRHFQNSPRGQRRPCLSTSTVRRFGLATDYWPLAATGNSFSKNVSAEHTRAWASHPNFRLGREVRWHNKIPHGQLTKVTGSGYWQLFFKEHIRRTHGGLGLAPKLQPRLGRMAGQQNYTWSTCEGNQLFPDWDSADRELQLTAKGGKHQKNFWSWTCRAPGRSGSCRPVVAWPSRIFFLCVDVQRNGGGLRSPGFALCSPDVTISFSC